MMVLLVMKVTTSPAPLLPVPTLWEQSAAPWARLNTTWAQICGLGELIIVNTNQRLIFRTSKADLECVNIKINIIIAHNIFLTNRVSSGEMARLWTRAW